MMRLLFAFVPFLFLAGCGKKDATPTGGGDPGQAADAKTTLPEARKGFATKTTGEKANRPVAEPPAKVFRKVKYDSPAGKLAAYLTPSPGDGKKRPAIIWITGGDCNSIDDVWSPPDPRSPGDESARQYREAGIVMMFPSLRGGNDNPGVKEGFYGEVDDVIAAADFLAKQDYVDSKRLYLGGHSTGGTLVMLVAASTDKFRAVFSFGPAEDVFFYPQPYVPFDRGNRREVELRSPRRWLHSIQCPTFVFEGTVDGNLDSLQAMARASTNPKAHFYPVKGATHFSLLAPVNRFLAQKILKDDGAQTNLAFTEAEVNQAVGK
jgi:pimeloyl-ACP methyl ester carboxylesterase